MQVRAIMTAALEAQKNGATVQVCPSGWMDALCATLGWT